MKIADQNKADSSMYYCGVDMYDMSKGTCLGPVSLAILVNGDDMEVRFSTIPVAMKENPTMFYLTGFNKYPGDKDVYQMDYFNMQEDEEISKVALNRVPDIDSDKLEQLIDEL